jgi:hypothetical protein
MSGGQFDYKQDYIQDIMQDIGGFIDTNDSNATNEWGDRMGRGYSPETISEFKKAIPILRAAYIYAKRIDWLLSGDDGEKNFHSRLKEQLEGENT